MVFISRGMVDRTLSASISTDFGGSTSSPLRIAVSSIGSVNDAAMVESRTPVASTPHSFESDGADQDYAGGHASRQLRGAHTYMEVEADFG